MRRRTYGKERKDWTNVHSNIRMLGKENHHRHNIIWLNPVILSNMAYVILSFTSTGQSNLNITVTSPAITRPCPYPCLLPNSPPAQWLVYKAWLTLRPARNPERAWHDVYHAHIFHLSLFLLLPNLYKSSCSLILKVWLISQPRRDPRIQNCH